MQNYLTVEQKKENIDPIKLEYSARKNFLTKLRNELYFDKQVCEFEGLSFNDFLQDIKKVLEEFE